MSIGRAHTRQGPGKGDLIDTRDVLSDAEKYLLIEQFGRNPKERLPRKETVLLIHDLTDKKWRHITRFRCAHLRRNIAHLVQLQNRRRCQATQRLRKQTTTLTMQEKVVLEIYLKEKPTKEVSRAAVEQIMDIYTDAKWARLLDYAQTLLKLEPNLETDRCQLFSRDRDLTHYERVLMYPYVAGLIPQGMKREEIKQILPEFNDNKWSAAKCFVLKAQRRLSLPIVQAKKRRTVVVKRKVEVQVCRGARKQRTRQGLTLAETETIRAHFADGVSKRLDKMEIMLSMPELYGKMPDAVQRYVDSLDKMRIAKLNRERDNGFNDTHVVVDARKEKLSEDQLFALFVHFGTSSDRTVKPRSSPNIKEFLTIYAHLFQGWTHCKDTDFKIRMAWQAFERLKPREVSVSL